MEDAANSVIYETAPFANTEEEIATSYYILQDDASKKYEDASNENIPSAESVTVVSVDDENYQAAELVQTAMHVEDTLCTESTVNAEVAIGAETLVSSENPVNAEASPVKANNKKVDKYTCQYCDRKFYRFVNMQKHVKLIHKIAIEKPITELTNSKVHACQYCERKFNRFINLQKHVKVIHKIDIENPNAKLNNSKATNTKCVECNLCFKGIYKLRNHLQNVHNLNMEEEELRFPNMNAFKKWKCEVERKSLCSYTLRHTVRKCKGGPKFLYDCHRSGKFMSKVHGPRKRMMKARGSCKMGIVCTAGILCHETPQEVIVKYCPHHYGHGKETTYIQLTPEEHNAICESMKKGVPYENLLGDIRENQSSKDHFQLYLLKKRYIRSINKAYETQDFYTDISDAESVDRWVRSCCQMETSPILYYQKEEFAVGGNREFMLVIMTEFQKHILLASTKKTVCVDNNYRRKGGRIYLTTMFVMDEMDLAFPVAFCISNSVNKSVILKFFTSISEHTGPLSTQYFMSDSENFYYDAWKEVMNDDSKWLWSMWYVDSRIRLQLRIYKGNTEKRAEVYKIMRILLECPSETVFTCMFENFIRDLRNNPKSREMGNFIQQKYGSSPQYWANCYRKDIELATIIHLEIMNRTFRYCCRLGRKERLDKFIYVLMKVIRDKMLDRLCNILDEERIELAIDAINTCHTMGLDILPEYITALSDKVWLIRSENSNEHFYVSMENVTCPEHCSLKCVECDICVHMYTCTCLNNLINANLCAHIHAVVWNFITPHFSPPVSDAEDIMQEIVHDSDYKERPKDCTELWQSVLKRTHQVYKMVQANKCGLSKDTLDVLMQRMNECADICAGKVKLTDNAKKTDTNVQNPGPTEPNNNLNTVFLINPYMANNIAQPSVQTSNIVPNTASAQYLFFMPKTAEKF